LSFISKKFRFTRKAQAARSAREENRDFPLKALFAFRGKSSFSQRASRWSWTNRKAQAARSAREENRKFPKKAPFAFMGNLSFSQRASRWS
jgi:hypothetical protein